MATFNHNLSSYDKERVPNAASLKFGIVVSEWNSKITDGLFEGAQQALLDCGAKPGNIIRWNVPGSYELTFGSKKIIETEA
ncbi:MAG: 6,7-dimethyl-8-ribityllumazine synthase, partial [Muriicola sp.]|nr:6,7-dimethyl-8-ribityllumazine synthase [Muriicola sp.]